MVVGATNILQPTLSPDGKRVAHTDNDGGMQQVFVGSFPDLKVKRLVSRVTGLEPRCRAAASRRCQRWCTSRTGFRSKR